jgi:hypothetical protein
MISRAKSGFSTVWHDLSSHDTILVDNIPVVLRELELQVYPGFLMENRMIMAKVDALITNLQSARCSDPNSIYLSKQETFDFLLELLSGDTEILLDRIHHSDEEITNIHTIDRKSKNVLDELDSIINQSSTFDKEMSEVQPFDGIGMEIDTNEQLYGKDKDKDKDREDPGPYQKASIHDFNQGESDGFTFGSLDPDEILTESDDDATSMMDLSHRRSLSYPSTIHENGCDEDKYSVKEAIDDVQQLHEQLKSKFNLIDVYLSQVKLQNSKDRDNLNDLSHKNDQMIQRLDNIKLQAVSLALKLKVLHLESQGHTEFSTGPPQLKYTFSLPQPDESHKVLKPTASVKPLDFCTPSTSKKSHSISLTNEHVSSYEHQALIQDTNTDGSVDESHSLSSPMIFFALIALVIAYISYYQGQTFGIH